AMLVLAIGLPAALSLLPYTAPLQAARAWDILVRRPIDVWELCIRAADALAGSGWWNIGIWLIAMLLGLTISAGQQIRRRSAAHRERRHHQDLLLFSGATLAAGVAAYLGFLQIVSYPTRPWYYLAPMALVAMMLDVILDAMRARREAQWAIGALVLI